MTSEERDDAARIFAAWEAELARSGGPFLGGMLSLADLAFVPTVVRLRAHAPDLVPWPLVARWMDALMARPAVREWMDEAGSLPPVVLDGYR
jgi:glutathione S-transferase